MLTFGATTGASVKVIVQVPLRVTLRVRVSGSRAVHFRCRGLLTVSVSSEVLIRIAAVIRGVLLRGFWILESLGHQSQPHSLTPRPKPLSAFRDHRNKPQGAK